MKINRTGANAIFFFEPQSLMLMHNAIDVYLNSIKVQVWLVLLLLLL
jgi:hypothetical protein